MLDIQKTNQFEKRARALEDSYSRQRDMRLLADLRAKLAEFEEEQQISRVSGIMDEHVLLDLVHVGVHADSLEAMRFVPMVAVAWSDGTVTTEQRTAILDAAASENLQEDTPAYQLLLKWLDQPIEEPVITAWMEYVREVVKLTPVDRVRSARDRCSRLCHRVAKASGGLLGIHAISQKERDAIRRFVSVWES